MEYSFILRHLGASAKYKGYNYLLIALKMIQADPSLLHSITKDVYAAIAAQYNTSWMDVEHCIRSLIRSMWKQNRQLLSYLIGQSLERCPSNSTFIAAVITLPEAFDVQALNRQLFQAQLFWNDSLFLNSSICTSSAIDLTKKI